MVISAGTTIAQVVVGVLVTVITAMYIPIDPSPLVGGFLLLVDPRRRKRTETVLECLHDRSLEWLASGRPAVIRPGATAVESPGP